MRNSSFQIWNSRGTSVLKRRTICVFPAKGEIVVNRQMGILAAEYRKKILLGAILSVLITSGLAVSASWMASKASTAQNSENSLVAQSQLILELTDPPNVPTGTTSLNLTFSEIDLSITTSTGLTQPLTVVPGSQYSTVDLLALENQSMTLGLSTIESGSQINSITFLVSNVSIGINGTSYPVSLATGGNALLVTMSDTPALEGATNALLLQFNPTIINTSTGYQLVPSSLGIVKPQDEITAVEGTIGGVQKLSIQDQTDLGREKGTISAQLMGMSVSGNVTTMSIQVTNTGKNPQRLILFGIHGGFTLECSSNFSDGGTDAMWKHCQQKLDEIVLIPGEPHSTSTTGNVTSCESRHLSLVNTHDITFDLKHPIIMNPGQCLLFSFSSIITFGNHVIIPSANYRGKYEVSVFANGARIGIDCSVPDSLTAAPNCSVVSGNDTSGD